MKMDVQLACGTDITEGAIRLCIAKLELNEEAILLVTLCRVIQATKLFSLSQAM